MIAELTSADLLKASPLPEPVAWLESCALELLPWPPLPLAAALPRAGVKLLLLCACSLGLPAELLPEGAAFVASFAGAALLPAPWLEEVEDEVGVDRGGLDLLAETLMAVTLVGVCVP